MKKVIVIVGPTAVGKSDFAIELAKNSFTKIFSSNVIKVGLPCGQ